MWNTEPVTVPAPADPQRRRFLRAAGSGSLALATVMPWLDLLAAQAPRCAPLPDGELVRTLPLYGLGSDPPALGNLLGSGLDARQYTDLSRITSTALVTPLDEVFVRTAPPPALPDAATWTLALRDVEGTVRGRVAIADLARLATPQGTHLMECAGNSNPWNFGLMSAVAFDGVPLEQALAALPQPKDAAGLLVTGYDHDTANTRQSLPGASWILPVDTLATTGAFLATTMGGRPLSLEHGAPVRLVVPGWYGCAWIKWVHDLRWVTADERSTTQMLEFAFRTHQDGIPMRARDYEVPTIDTAAMPVRVEQRRVDGRTEYRIVGIVWGGASPVDRLLIRFGSRDPGAPVQVCPAPVSARSWTLWSYRWQPTEPGYYDITVKAADQTVRTRRLDVSFYIRRVKVDEV